MERRRYLVKAAGAAGLACGVSVGGCLGVSTTTDPPTRNPASATSDDTEPTLVRAAARDAIPAIVEPAFAADWSDVVVTVSNEFGTYDASLSLAPHELVVGVVREGRARAYPLRVLTYHEAVNDVFTQRSMASRTASDTADDLLVTYCPLCGSAVVASRVIEGRHLTFGVSGLLWHDNLVLYDRETDSLWSQNGGEAIRGPLSGTSLPLLPSTVTTWGEWQAAHPDGEVLLPPPYSNTVSGRVATRDYTLDPYGGYATNRQVGLSDRALGDDRLHPKAQVLGVVAGDEARAYPLAVVSAERVVNDVVGDVPVVVAADGSTMVGYDRRVDGETLTFAAENEDALAGGGSTWALSTGEALDGPHARMRLRRVTDRPPLFWFSWLDFHPETMVYGPE